MNPNWKSFRALCLWSICTRWYYLSTSQATVSTNIQFNYTRTIDGVPYSHSRRKVLLRREQVCLVTILLLWEQANCTEKLCLLKASKIRNLATQVKNHLRISIPYAVQSIYLTDFTTVELTANDGDNNELYSLHGIIERNHKSVNSTNLFYENIIKFQFYVFMDDIIFPFCSMQMKYSNTCFPNVKNTVICVFHARFLFAQCNLLVIRYYPWYSIVWIIIKIKVFLMPDKYQRKQIYLNHFYIILEFYERKNSPLLRRLFRNAKANASDTIVIIAKQCSRYIMTMESDCLIHNRKSCFHFVMQRVARLYIHRWMCRFLLYGSMLMDAKMTAHKMTNKNHDNHIAFTFTMLYGFIWRARKRERERQIGRGRERWSKKKKGNRTNRRIHSTITLYVSGYDMQLRIYRSI